MILAKEVTLRHQKLAKSKGRVCSCSLLGIEESSSEHWRSRVESSPGLGANSMSNMKWITSFGLQAIHIEYLTPILFISKGW